MSIPTRTSEAAGQAGFDRGFDGHWRRQVRRGLELTPAQRLRWLEQAMQELRPLVGRARRAKPIARRDSNAV